MNVEIDMKFTLNKSQQLSCAQNRDVTSNSLRIRRRYESGLKEHYRIGFADKTVAGSVSTLCNTPDI